MRISAKLIHYAYLLRLDKPIGIGLLLWPTLWAVWLASAGHPQAKTLFIFIAGVVLMRSAGCAINDFADRGFDHHVERTRTRPLASGAIKAYEAIFLAGMLLICAFQLLLFCNGLTMLLAFVGLLLTIIYPFMKRYTHMPQLVLGAAFAWGVPMAFAEVQGVLIKEAWLLYATALLWPLIYDTMYAMVDCEEDKQIGVKSTAILFGRFDRIIIAILQFLFLSLLIACGLIFHLSAVYDTALVLVAALFLYQQWLIRKRDRLGCFRAFTNNNWVGFIIFIGLVADLRGLG